ncbi:MmgE/PrpD family protein [Pseudomonas chlororaphis]|uniref:MmgE/PrpD family protein n=1 Tax=Pseudomonas chlororaphis TaxID=587753 RepID=A0AAX3G8B5_9PSED|nr:MmgE/PrpD family protein [Pseudomonas chlororaphis]AZC36989.1 Immune-responsive protein 1 [Pseudomonas chlororaphis subsp. piscium]AZC43535.1 Immune-responsive protein 1 [Pseudomonas chlororaphis subsp. piscium]WDG75400.1 MmgE/PrpD family protein [Pseudomonas chlororaphis]WDH26964.1 MmgE/PrpD family protein [Pseudomonas chlororaphis]WDH73920.1 MmgE/PrpD family protein [Pseudomonas chlororaphis]
MSHTQALAGFLAGLSYQQLPDSVLARTEELFLDWLGSALASQGAHPIPLFERYARHMGPADGPARILVNGRGSSAYFAALVNAASSHLVEQDDLHNSAVLHPATVVFPAALAAAQDLGKSGQDLLLAAVAGYEAGIRIGEFMGRSHYRIFHTTATVGTLAAAVAVGKLMDFDQAQFIDLLGSAGTQAAGLWEFLRDAADSKQLHTAKAAADGLLAAYLTRDGLTGARDILEGEQGMAAGMSWDAEPSRLSDRLGSRWALLETSFKFHASCRHTHPAADALLALMQREGLSHEQIAQVETRVHQGAIDVLGRVDVPQTVHQAKFSMGTVLGLIAVHGKAGLPEFHELALKDPAVAAFRDKVAMLLDPEVDRAYPQRWLGRVRVSTVDGRILHGAIDEPKGDPGNGLSRAELEDKFQRLLRFSGARTVEQGAALIRQVWHLRDTAQLNELL